MRVYRRLVDELREKQRLAWVEADMGRLVEEAASVPPAGDYYRRIKGAWKLPPEGLARLQAMARWREQEAREMNRPRNRIVPDRVLLEVARRDPSSRQALFAIDDFHPRAVKRYGDRLLELCRAAAANADVPPDTLPAPLDREARKHLATCRDIVDGRAKALGLAPEVLARKKELESLVRTALTGRPELPPALADGWRHAIVGEELLKHVRETPL
jgi:ribonuclease D